VYKVVQRRFALMVLLVLTAAGLGPGRPTSGAPPQDGQVLLFPTSPSQGQTLFVQFRAEPDAANVTCTWDGRAIPVARSEATALATIGIRIDERPGKHTLRVKTWGADGAARVERRDVTVRRTAWPVQRLRMKPSTEKLYTFPGAKAEDAAVTAATRTFSPDPLWRGGFLVPTEGRHSTAFGVKRIRNGRRPYYHRGVDLAAPTGTPIIAANSGRVVLARDFTKYGKTVVLDHGLGVTTLYLHMSALAVRKGDLVERGQRIGDVGAEGVATGPHLHWSLYVHGNSVSPLFWTRLPEAVTRVARG
jgi:murein DD-endopeptidase MepM/ murein hydrolase activator NlpD